MKFMLRYLTVVIIVLVSTIGFVPRHSPALAASGTIEGYVGLLGGDRLVGVEVFLGIQTDPFEARYTCTDELGQFRFTDLPLDTTYIVAAGTEVEFGERCSNPLPLNPYVRNRQPLLVQTYHLHNGLGMFDTIELTAAQPSIAIKFELEKWPTNDDLILNNRIIRAIQQFQAGRTDRAIATFELFKNRVELLRSRGRMDDATADLNIRYADDLIAFFSDSSS